MRQFLKLSKQIININYIKNIHIYETNFHITFSPIETTGWHLLSVGLINSKEDYCNIWKEESTEDFKIIEDWIKTLE